MRSRRTIPSTSLDDSRLDETIGVAGDVFIMKRNAGQSRVTDNVSLPEHHVHIHAAVFFPAVEFNRM